MNCIVAAKAVVWHVSFLSVTSWVAVNAMLLKTVLAVVQAVMDVAKVGCKSLLGHLVSFVVMICELEGTNDALVSFTGETTGIVTRAESQSRPKRARHVTAIMPSAMGQDQTHEHTNSEWTVSTFLRKDVHLSDLLSWTTGGAITLSGLERYGKVQTSDDAEQDEEDYVCEVIDCSAEDVVYRRVDIFSLEDYYEALQEVWATAQAEAQAEAEEAWAMEQEAMQATMEADAAWEAEQAAAEEEERAKMAAVAEAEKLADEMEAALAAALAKADELLSADGCAAGAQSEGCTQASGGTEPSAGNEAVGKGKTKNKKKKKGLKKRPRCHTPSA